MGCLNPKYRPPGRILVTSIVFRVSLADVMTSTKFEFPDGKFKGTAVWMYWVV
jgi:hypothetical protein